MADRIATIRVELPEDLASFVESESTWDLRTAMRDAITSYLLRKLKSSESNVKYYKDQYEAEKAKVKST